MIRRRTGKEGSMFPMPNEYVPAKSGGAVGEPQQQKQSSKTVSFPMPNEYVSADGRVGRRGVPRLRSRIQTFVYQNGQWMKFGAPQYMTTEQARQNIEQAVQGGFTDPIGYGGPGAMPEWILSGGRWLTAAEAMRAAAVTTPEGCFDQCVRQTGNREACARHCGVTLPVAEQAPPPGEAEPAPAPPPGPSWQPPPTSDYSANWLVFVKQPRDTRWERTGEVIQNVPFDKAKNTLFEQKALYYSGDVIVDSRCYAVAELPPPPGPGEPARPEPYSPTVFIGCGRRVRI